MFSTEHRYLPGILILGSLQRRPQVVSGGLRPLGNRGLTLEENPPEGDDSLESTEPCVCADVFAHTNSSLVGDVVGNDTKPIAKPFSSLTGLQKANGLLQKY